MVIRPDWRHFWSPFGSRMMRGGFAILGIVFVTLVWFLLRFKVSLGVDSPVIELLLLVLRLMLILCWVLALLFGILIALLVATLLGERLELQEGVVVRRMLFRQAQRVAIADGTRLRCEVPRKRSKVDVLESLDGKTSLVLSRRVYGDRLDVFWARAGLEPEAGETVTERPS
jgi:hypothetical protein